MINDSFHLEKLFCNLGEKATNVMIFVFLGVKWRSAHSKAKENRTRLLSDIEYFELALVQSQHKILFLLVKSNYGLH